MKTRTTIVGAASAILTVGLAVPAFAQGYHDDYHDAVDGEHAAQHRDLDAEHNDLHQDLDSAHAQMHASGAAQDPRVERRWHRRAERMHDIEHMNDDAQHAQGHDALERDHDGYHHGAPTNGYGTPAYREPYGYAQPAYVAPPPSYGRSFQIRIGR